MYIGDDHRFQPHPFLQCTCSIFSSLLICLKSHQAVLLAPLTQLFHHYSRDSVPSDHMSVVVELDRMAFPGCRIHTQVSLHQYRPHICPEHKDSTSMQAVQHIGHYSSTTYVHAHQNSYWEVKQNKQKTPNQEVLCECDVSVIV